MRADTPVSRIELHSLLSPDCCATVLQEAIVGDQGWVESARDRRVAGTVSETSLRLRKRKRFYSNSFPTYLHASLAAEGSGTRISVSRGQYLSTPAFLLAWLGFLLLAGALAWVQQLHHPQDPLQPEALMVALLGGGIVAIGRLHAASERAFLLEFLAGTLQARQVDVAETN